MPDSSSRRRRHNEHSPRREPVTCSRHHGLAFWLAFCFEHKSTVSHCFGTTGQRICYLSSTWGDLLWDKNHCVLFLPLYLLILPSWSSMVFSLWEIHSKEMYCPSCLCQGAPVPLSDTIIWLLHTFCFLLRLLFLRYPSDFINQVILNLFQMPFLNYWKRWQQQPQ